MNRFHVHLHVADLERSIGFYSTLSLNFAISTRGGRVGIDHLGLQADDDSTLAAMKGRAAAADRGLLDEGEVGCCYARNFKHWVTDPQGVAWEHFHTLADIPTFGESGTATPTSAPAPATPATASAPQGCCGTGAAM